MPYNPDKHHRRSIRLEGYDYRQEGMYFVTLCTHDRGCLFGDVVDGQMRLTSAGEVIQSEWEYTAVVRSHVILDAYVIMPNHFHGIIVIERSSGSSSRASEPDAPTKRPNGPKAGSIGAIIAQFKRQTTVAINRLRDVDGGLVWQRNYWERVIRDEQELNAIRAYIETNPVRWETDDLYITPL